jgi:hypothetical protein
LKVCIFNKNTALRRHFHSRKVRLLALLFLFVFALLISDAAAGLASGLAGSLAFAASAVLCAVAEVACIYGFDVLHGYILR